MADSLDRIQFLMGQSRWEPAESELRQALTSDPDSGVLLTLLATCLLELERNSEALAAAKKAVAAEPDNDTCHYTLALAYMADEQYVAAMQSAEAALRLDPEDGSNHRLKGQLLLRKRQWQPALDCFDQAVALDPEDTAAYNLRGIALRQLGDGDDALEQVDAVLSIDPESPMSIAHRGWQMIEVGDYEQAEKHFHEALRLDPEFEWARNGLAEVLKARSPFYRVILRYEIWMSKLSSGQVWAVLLGAYFLVRILRSAARSNPGLAPFVTPIVLVYVLFVYVSWLGTPLFDSLLRLHPLGRHILGSKQRNASTALLLLFAAALLAGLGSVVTDISALWVLALVMFMMTIPVTKAVGIDSERGAAKLKKFATALGIVAALAVGFEFAGNESSATFLGLFFLGILGFTIYANKVVMEFS